MDSSEKNDAFSIKNIKGQASVNAAEIQKNDEKLTMLRRFASKRVTLPIGAIIACVIAIVLSVAAIIGVISIVKRINNKTVHVIETPVPGVSDQNTPSFREQLETTPIVTPFYGGTDRSDEPENEYLIIENAMKAVVSIDVMAQQGYSSVAKSFGSGIIVSRDGYIVTCSHVVDGASKIYVYLDDGTSSEAKLVGSDTLNDLAVIKIEGRNYPFAVLGDSNSLRMGENVFAIGNALGQLSNTYTRGVVSGFGRKSNSNSMEMALLQTDAAVNKGNSGGGLFRASDGRLIGIVNAKSNGQDIDGLGFAIPSSEAQCVIEDLIQYGFVTGRPYLGAETETITISDYGFFTSKHTYPSIISIDDDSPAMESGLLVGDIILSVNGVTVSDSSMLESVLNEYNIGDTVVFSILRDQTACDISITLGERRASGR